MSHKQQKIKTLLIRSLVLSPTDEVNTASIFKILWFPNKHVLPIEASFQDSLSYICSRSFPSCSSITKLFCFSHQLCGCRGFICPLCHNFCIPLVVMSPLNHLTLLCSGKQSADTSHSPAACQWVLSGTV